jgi:oxygen-independent coproporphyrinogen III oxidase
MRLCQSWRLTVTNKNEPLGLYLHIPFCLNKCDYCDFYSLPVNANNNEEIEIYTRCLIVELKQRCQKASAPFASIYLGGGTPSLLKPKQIESILDTIFGNYQAGFQPEITMEVNPATVNLRDMKDFRSAGVNRLSIGVQSFSDRELKVLGRLHGREEAIIALDNAARAGFMNFSADLIYGIPGQQEADWYNNLREMGKHEPPHLSIYLLQLEESTPLAKKIATGLVQPVDEDFEIRLYRMALDYLQQQGYNHYEISNLARPGYECCHNMIYWRGSPYLGFGCGAVSFDGVSRFLNQPPLREYIEALRAGRKPLLEVLETMNDDQRAADALILGLRLTAGIDLADFNDRFGINILQRFEEAIFTSCEQNLLVIKDGRLYLDPRAYFLSNQVFSRFFG